MMIRRLRGRIKAIVVVALSFFTLEALGNDSALQPVSKIYLRKEKDLYTLCVDFNPKIVFTPRMHTLSNGVKILLSFDREVTVPKTRKITHPVIRGYFFEGFSPSSLMFVVALNENVTIISKKYAKSSLKICFKVNKKHTIILDAGHGGRDPGAKSVSGNYEKNITLITAIELRNLLVQSNKYKVILTRSSDVYASIDERKEKIKAIKADILISLHTDSNNDKNLRGMTIYSSSPSDLSNVDVFSDVAVRSRRFADNLIRYIPGICQIKNRPCRRSDFKILEINIPAILVELGCISNKKDDELLHSRSFREKTIRAIKYALDDFFKKEK
ncbi:MAG: N-acetylmuramoyl-L-alanine amidase [Holosporaceae bacterium]|jgi:N-acetylmuramoyl-L-alanine amidase|nr:N-acetylmuramoyl-L-alanine amidase [Holosporaceae bacterium]